MDNEYTSIYDIEPGHVIGYTDSGKPIRVVAGGSEPLYDGSESTTGGEGQQGNDQGNPAWGEFLAVVPQELHHQITPMLKKWDDGVNERFNKVHSDYAAFKPFKESGVDPAVLQQGYQIHQALQTDPKRVFEALVGAYPDLLEGIQQQSGQGQQEPTADDLLQKRLDAMDQQQRQIAEVMIAQHRAEEVSRADAQLDREFNEMRNKYGVFDDEWVLSKLERNPNMSVEAAVQSYRQFEDSIKAKYAPKPLFIGGGSSGLPGSAPDVTKLSNAETNNYVAEILRRHAEAQQ